MVQITTITEHTYIFYCDGNFFMQDNFDSDEAALKRADSEAKERGKPVKVARWIYPAVEVCNCTRCRIDRGGSNGS